MYLEKQQAHMYKHTEVSCIHTGVFTQTLEGKFCPTKNNVLISMESRKLLQKSYTYRLCFVHGEGCTLLGVWMVKLVEGGSNVCNFLQNGIASLRLSLHPL